MITITPNDGKTYKVQSILDTNKEVSDNRLKYVIYHSDLEEVKQNKEMPDIVQREKEAKEGMKQVWDSIRKAQELSILEKLREELDKLEKYIGDASRERKTSDTYSIKGYLQCLNDVKNLLTSLETKEEPIPPTDKGREQYIADHPEELARQPQEDIELLRSFDGNPIQGLMQADITLYKQVELLTNAVNQLIKANKNLGK